MPTRKPDGYVVDFPTLWIVPSWIEAHCPIYNPAAPIPTDEDFDPDVPMVELYDWQLWGTVNHYRVRPDAKVGQLGPAFYYRRSQIVAPQKTGKGPWLASITAAEAVGPVLFAGWARRGDVYRCADHGCSCGWVYRYRKGEPMGRPWGKPLIQLLANSEGQTTNVYGPLQAMARSQWLRGQMRVGEEFIRLWNQGRIDAVTSAARSRLGQPITFAGQDENGLYTDSNGMRETAQTQRRGLAGMGGRSIQTTNAWNPAENSDAQATMESLRTDIFRFWRRPPEQLRYEVKAERAKIHRYVYAGSKHVDLAGIEAEAAELLETDPAQAERFFGNRAKSGKGSWQPQGLWSSRTAPRRVPDGSRICLGFDGSDVDDWSAIRAETLDGYQFTPVTGPDWLPTIWDPAQHAGRIPRLEVHAAVDELFTRYRVVRMYCDPRDWQTEIETWALKYGTKRVMEWATNRTGAMHESLVRFTTDLATGELTHDGCPVTERHVGNARRLPKPGQRYILGKASPKQKIDAAMSSVVCHEARCDAVAAGARSTPPPRRRAVVLS